MAQRSGSPLRGCGIVFLKELSDHLHGARMLILEWLVLLTGVGAVFAAIQGLRLATAQDSFLFLRLFTDARPPMPSFAGVLVFLIPLVAIGLGFDSINGEFNRRTMSRVLAQPIYRDALLFGKYLASLATLAVALLTLWLLVVGLGLVTLGVPPSGDELLRCTAFLIVCIVYGGFWLALATLGSVLFRSAATAALGALGVWLFLGLLWPMLAQFVAALIYPSDVAVLLGVPSVEQIQLQQVLAHFSPGTLFEEAVVGLLNPATRAFGLVFAEQMQGAVRGAPLPFLQSVLLVWAQVTGLVAGSILLFVAAYVSFQRQEVRA